MGLGDTGAVQRWYPVSYADGMLANWGYLDTSLLIWAEFPFCIILSVFVGWIRIGRVTSPIVSLMVLDGCSLGREIPKPQWKG